MTCMTVGSMGWDSEENVSLAGENSQIHRGSSVGNISARL